MLKRPGWPCRRYETLRQLCREIQAEMVSPAITKSDRSPVTVADYASQALVAHMLIQASPGERLVAEEDSQTLKADPGGETLARVTGYLKHVLPGVDAQQVCALIDHGAQEPGERFWTLDPIDGTKGFLRGDQYVTALALIEDGVVQVAALGCPNLDRGMSPAIGGAGSAVVAVRGHGCYSYGMLDEERSPIRVQRIRIGRTCAPAAIREVRAHQRGQDGVTVGANGDHRRAGIDGQPGQVCGSGRRGR